MENTTNNTPAQDTPIPSGQTPPLEKPESREPATPPSQSPPPAVTLPIKPAVQTETDKALTPPGSTPQKMKSGIPFPLLLLLLIISFLGGLILATWYFQQQLKSFEKEPEKATQTATQQTVRIGTNAQFAPMEFVDDKGTLQGYDIDLGYRLATEMNVKAEYQNIPWDELFTALEQKKIDMIISAVTITDDRKKQFDFSEPYLYAGQVIITKNDIFNTASETAQLQGKKIGVARGTTSETEALKQTSEPLVTRYPDIVQATNALKTNQVDVLLADLTSAKSIVKFNQELTIVNDPLTSEAYGIVLRKNDPRKKALNAALASLEIKGIMTDLKQKWLD